MIDPRDPHGEAIPDEGRGNPRSLFAKALQDVSPLLAGSPRPDLPAASDAPPHAAGSSQSSGQAVLPLPVIPGYQVIRRVGAGGQGMVYEAIHQASRRRVAIKLLAWSRFEATSRARLEREIELLSGIDHPGVAAIRDCGDIQGMPYLVMDFVDGIPLDRWLDRRRLAEPELLALFVRICDVVNAAHLRGVIHRDLKPANILVDDSGCPHVVDFGLARAGGTTDQREVTQTGQFVGSLPWASPEQASGSGRDLDLRTDVYSLGVVLYQAFVGTFPHSMEGSPSEIVERIRRDDPIPPRRARSSSGSPLPSRDMEAVILRCLRKDRERRYQSALELRRDLERILSGEPVEARRESRWYVLRRTVRRHRRPIALGGALLGLLMATAVISTVLYRRASAEAERAKALVSVLSGVLEGVDPSEYAFDMTPSLRRIEQLHSSQLQGDPRVAADFHRALAVGYMSHIDRSIQEALLGLARQITALDRIHLDDPEEERRLRFRTEMLRATLRGRIIGREEHVNSFGRIVEHLVAAAPDMEREILMARFIFGAAALQAGDPARAIDSFREVLATAETKDGPLSFQASLARQSIGMAVLAAGRCDEGRGQLDEWQRLIELSPTTDAAAHRAAWIRLHWFAIALGERCGDPDLTREHARRMDAIFEQMRAENAATTEPAMRMDG